MQRQHETDVVTGAFSYTGRYIAERLQAAGRNVRSLTNRPAPPDTSIEVAPLVFDDTATLHRAMQGAEVLYNTYWVRFPGRGRSFESAVRNSMTLFNAAKDAGVRHIVHVSITNPSFDSPLQYFSGKAAVEESLKDVGVSYSIVRPTVVFGREDVMINNIAWLLRHFPIFAIAGNGTYRVRPVHVDDVARICVDLGINRTERTVDAVGPRTYSFDEFVSVVKDAVDGRAKLIRLPSPLVKALAAAVSVALRDRLLTSAELDGLMAGLSSSHAATTGDISFEHWLHDHHAELGRHYVSEMKRNFAPAERRQAVGG